MKKHILTLAAVLLASSMTLNLAACGAAAGTGASGSTQADAAAGGAAGSTAESGTGGVAAAGNSAGSAAEGAGTVTVTDEADRQVTVPVNPERAAVLDIYPMAAALTVYLNSAKSLVAMEPASMNAAKNSVLSELYPEILDVDTDILSGNDVNVEALMALDPQVVFVSAGNDAEIKTLENAGLTAVAISPSKWDYDCIRTYEEWTGLLAQIYPDRGEDRAKKVSGYSGEKYGAIQAKVSGLADEDRQKVLFLFQYDDQQMITSGKHFFGQWWCDAVGAKNAAEEIAGENRNAPITMEQVYSWNPDVIILTNFTQTKPEDLLNNAVGSDDWSTVKAVRDGRVYKMPLGTYRSYTPGVDTPITLEWLAQKVYPDLFGDLDVKADTVSYYRDIYGITLTDQQVESMFNPDPSGGKLNN